MPHDHDEKPPPPEAPPAFDFDKLPRWRSKIFSAPDDAPAEPAPQKPAPAPARETAQEFDPDMLPAGTAPVSAPRLTTWGEARAAQTSTGALTPQDNR